MSLLFLYNQLKKRWYALAADNPAVSKIYDFLKAMGVNKFVNIVACGMIDNAEKRNPTEQMKLEKTVFTENNDRILRVRDNLDDEKSRRVFSNLIHYRMSKDRRYLKGIMDDKDQYFPQGIVHLSEREVFVDCGAFKGDTIKEFVKRVNGHYKKIIAFEPDEQNFAALCKINRGGVDVLPIQAGVWSNDGVLRFDSEGTSESRVNETGNSEISVMRIDSVPECRDATFIKMDIEGAEREALKGAESVIRQNRPKLAICLYHQPEDFFEIPEYILSLDLHYRLYVRHHHYNRDETLLYAIPDKSKDP